jgi:hypothetical protein
MISHGDAADGQELPECHIEKANQENMLIRKILIGAGVSSGYVKNFAKPEQEIIS